MTFQCLEAESATPPVFAKNAETRMGALFTHGWDPFHRLRKGLRPFLVQA